MKYILSCFISILTLTLFAQEGTPEIIRGDELLLMEINVEDRNNTELIDGVDVYLYETTSDQLAATKTTEEGKVIFDIDPLKEYEVRTCHPDYLRNGLSIFECNEGDEILCVSGAASYNYVAAGGKDKPDAYFRATLSLSGIGIGSIFELDNVYYDLDKATLRAEGKKELDDLSLIMNRNKSIKIELSSHTDSRATNSYNKDLSQRRAESCYNYLVSKGIDAGRIIPKGYGENKLVNNCKDGVECTEAQHQRNRRTVIEVLAYEAIECVPGKEMDFKPKDLKNDPENLSNTKVKK